MCRHFKNYVYSNFFKEKGHSHNLIQAELCNNHTVCCIALNKSTCEEVFFFFPQ